MKILEAGVSGLNFSLRSAQLPKIKNDIEEALIIESEEEFESLTDLGRRLGSVPSGTGHDCFLKGITVNVIIEATTPFWRQFDRYSFQDTISSTSQMHTLLEQDLDDKFDEDTSQEQIDLLKERIEEYKEDKSEKNYRRVIMSVPSGYLYTRAIQTNYLQLKTMYHQRKGHKLSEWAEFREWCLSLPGFAELIGEDDVDDGDKDE